ncbi:hypothetical protein PV328_003617 [Microctonus aethiopoides]|uniref:Uncharacterized protein n=2 Tax=Microctonus aethiopoides TaxID=144406 RepID=A0AA39F908_9HYME|nr:hypothetical protein PV328_003617 [Microctonus aethiopoides]
MCGNIVRTGAGKVTGAIARELSQKKTEKKTRIPIAFKVVNKKIIPCINKFETKPETHMWIQENQRVTNLYNRGRTFTEGIVKQNRRMENYWRQSKVNSIVENPVSRLALSSLVNNGIIINNNSKNRFINESEMKIKYELISPESQQCLQTINDDFKENTCDENNGVAFDRKSIKRSLLSKFNDSDVKVSNKNINTNQLTGGTKLKPLRESNDYSQRFSNVLKKNNCDVVECLTTKKEQYKMKTISPESLEFLEHFQLESKTHIISNDNIDEIIRQSPIDSSLKADPKSFLENMKINSKSMQLHSDHMHYTKPKELFSEICAKKYQKQNFVSNCDNEILLQSGFRLEESQSYSPTRTLQSGIKRHYFDLTDTPPSPSKISKSNYEHQYHKTFTKNSAIDIEIHQYYTSQTISNESIDRLPQSQLSLPNISPPSSRRNSYLHTNSFNKVFENNDRTKMSISHICTKSSSIQWKSSLKSNLDQNFSVSPMRSNHENSRGTWEKMTSEDFDCPENEISTQDSRTTCTLTPDINEMLTEINASVAPGLETISTQVSVDLLDRQPFLPLIHSSNNETAMNIDSEIFCTSYNTQQRNMECKEQKFFKLSDFCSEYDKDLETLENILINKKITIEYISMEKIEFSINKALEILESSESDD